MAITILHREAEPCLHSSNGNRKTVREVTPVYWRKLIEVGVPIDTAEVIAWAIARYDLGKRLPNAYQQKLIQQYCRFVCRAELWRVSLLAASL